ncbi:hypothetical protein GIB67_033655 [Kingdonia uniflora]|uniref:E3 ubiquitin-protein ligase CHIP n=1 Tax=Kingdonia uniflora TaxID=39325 RepID=A0A7J7LAG4_9MAGN|nr:hypothetical protein GIB67_033655 [Kingdonia uniflora]
MSYRGSAAATKRQAEILKQTGNLCFTKERFGAAIDAYTEAITLCPNVPIYWTNRALCHLKRNDYTKVENDCTKALQLDSNTLKAHYLLGLALLQRQQHSLGIKELEKALELGRIAKGYMVEVIWQEIAKAKYAQWEHGATNRTCRLQSLKDVCEKALKEKYLRDASEAEGFVDETEKVHLEQLEYLKEVLNKAAEADMPTEVPDHLCCGITLDILRDPVIIPSGATYERAVLLEHLEKVGKWDPITRTPLSEHQLVPNFAIKEAVQAFLKDNGWAYKLG